MSRGIGIYAANYCNFLRKFHPQEGVISSFKQNLLVKVFAVEMPGSLEEGAMTVSPWICCKLAATAASLYLQDLQCVHAIMLCSLMLQTDLAAGS